MSTAIFQYKHELVFVRILIPYTLGIITFYGRGRDQFFIIFLLLLICILIAIATRIISSKSPVIDQKNWLNGFMLHCLFFLEGSLSCVLYDKRNHSDYYRNISSNFIKLKIVSEPEIKQNIILFDALITKSIAITNSLSIDNKSKFNFTPASGNLQVIIRIKTADSLTLRYGEELLLPCRFSEIAVPQNPFEFDYKNWLATQNIYQKIILSSSELIRINVNSGNRLIQLGLKLRAQQVALFREIIKDDNAFAVACTLILGYKADLSSEVVDNYSKTGTIHVLSVSGMHVGLIFLVLNWLMRFLSGKRIANALKTFVILAIIWFYALLTGFSPSVLRAAVMISIYIIAKLFTKNTNSYNIIAFAAFSLLVYNPFFVWDVGFQLSFLAVLGLVYLQPKINRLFTFKLHLLNRLWEAIAMSLAAQLATFPLSIYYFHQFPVYFLLSNLFIILPATLIMYLGILISVLKLECLGALFEWLIVFMNLGLSIISRFPGSVISAIWLNRVELILLCLALALFLISLIELKKKLLLSALVLLIMLQVSFGYKKVQTIHQRKTIRFNLKKNYAVALLRAQHAILLTDLSPGSKLYHYSVKPALDQHGITKVTFKPTP